jgi:hypothetical protein
MLAKPTTILGVNPGAKYLGLAILQDGDLRSWEVKNIHGKWSKKKMAKIMGIINDYVTAYNASTVCLKKINPARSSKQLLSLAENIRSYCQSKNIKVYQYSIQEIKTIYSSTQIKIDNRKSLAEVIAEHYPILFNELKKEQRYRNAYYIRMFEAVALALAVIL